MHVGLQSVLSDPRCGYFLSQFARAERKKGGEFYTPRCVVKLPVEMLEPCLAGMDETHAD